MITRTPFSSISYNTDDFLQRKLNDLIEDRTLSFWCFINHKAEGITEEGEEKKDHKHVLMIPNGQIDTFSLIKYFEEPDFEHPDLPPLDCKAYKHSQFADWYLYALHDRDYLYTKGKVRKYHYTRDQFICYDADYLTELVLTSDFTKWKKVAEFRDAVKQGKEFSELLVNGFIPIQQIYQYARAYEIMLSRIHPERVESTDDLNKMFKLYKDGTLVRRSTGEIVTEVDMPFVFDDGGDE